MPKLSPLVHEIEDRRTDMQKTQCRVHGRKYADAKYRMDYWRKEAFGEFIESIHDQKCVTLLDVGCGRGESAIVMDYRGMSKGNWRGVEVVPELCAIRRVALIPGAHDLGFIKDNRFDLVVALDVLEHIVEEDITQSLAEIFRVAIKRAHFSISHDDSSVSGHSKKWWMDKVTAAVPETARVTVRKVTVPDNKAPHTFIDIVL